jgi:uncharacterized protein YkwD
MKAAASHPVLPLSESIVFSLSYSETDLYHRTMLPMNRILFSILLLFSASSCAVREEPNVLTPEQQARMENNVFVHVNGYRKSKNLRPLVSSESLAQVARTHSIGMQRSNQMNHDGFSGRVSKVRKLYPRTYVAENVGFNYGLAMPEKTIVAAWINSQGHRINILGNYDYTGVGITQSAEGKIYFTQLFVSPL